jgi:hypothetical protein
MARVRSARGGSGGSSGAAGVMRFMTRSLNTYRGTTANAYGDETDVGTPYLTGVQAALAETSQTAFDPATQRPQIIRAITCMVPGWADIVTTDTIQDPATGLVYMIENLSAAPSIGYYPPMKVLTLRVRSGVSIASD